MLVVKRILPLVIMSRRRTRQMRQASIAFSMSRSHGRSSSLPGWVNSTRVPRLGNSVSDEMFAQRWL